ncbi:MAG: bifunctional adenosylcobinamide kinase/adenosylcobinamide-phosphate guanylyltransferase [Pseudomonadota bacterium]
MGHSQSILILGGARSGKSSFAQALAEEMARSRGGRPGIVATAEALDDEMAARINKHKSDRGDEWLSAEEPLDLPSELLRFAPQCGSILVDCLTLWLSNLMHAQRNLEEEAQALIAALNSCVVPVIMVSNEVGLGLVPETPLGRAFRDAQGRLNQDVAQACDQVTFIAAGLPLHLKGSASL